MATATPPRPRTPLLEQLGLPEVPEVRAPAWFDRLPPWASSGGILVVLLAISAFIRSRQLSGQLWFGEAQFVGVASHSLGSLYGALRASGSSPLYAVLLHFWIRLFGSGETTLHLLSLLTGLASIPLSMWAAGSLWGRRAGIFAAILFAFDGFLTRWAQQVGPYELMVVLGLLAATGFLHGLVYRRRRFLWLLGVPLAAMLYTQVSGLAFYAGALVAWTILVALAGEPERRRRLVLDGALVLGLVALAYVPWVPALVHQVSGDTSPWSYVPLLGASVPGDLLGAGRVDMTLLVAAVVGLGPLFTRRRWRGTEAQAAWSLIAIPGIVFLAGLLASLAIPAWASRHFAAAVGPLLLLGTLACARARAMGVAAVLLVAIFCANPGSFVPTATSDMGDVAGELAPLLHRGDVVVVGQPEQTPLAHYYLPAGLEYFTTAGGSTPVAEPSYMDWSGALGQLRSVSPGAAATAVVASLKPGQQLLYVRPLTEGNHNWESSWTRLVRRRSAQWGQALERAASAGVLAAVAFAPHDYPSACCVADSAVLYRKRT